MNEIEEFFLLLAGFRQEEKRKKYEDFLSYNDTTRPNQIYIRLLLTTTNQSIQKTEEAKSNRIESNAHE
jgi:hypothetical protein